MKPDLMHINNLLRLIKEGKFEVSGQDCLAVAAAWKWLLERKSALEEEARQALLPPVAAPSPKKGKK